MIIFKNGSSNWKSLGTTVIAEDDFLPVDLRTELDAVPHTKWWTTFRNKGLLSCVRRVTLAQSV